MKKILSFICMLAMVCTVLVPMTSVEVEAAAFQGWTLSGGAYVEDGVLHMMSNPTGGKGSQATVTAATATGNSMLPDQYTILFSMKVNSLSSSCGLQGGNGNNRAGFYFVAGGFRGMDTAVQASMNYVGEWHDFMIEVDHVTKTEKVYLDDNYMGTITLANSGAKNQFYFWCEKTDGDYEVSDFSIVTEDTGASDQLTLGKEYTEAFRQDWDTIGGWMVEPGYQVEHYPEKGIIRLHVEEENFTYRSIERPLRPPTNYDMEFSVMIPEEKEGIYSGMTAFELSTDSRHTWLYVQKDKITFNDIGGTSSVALYDRANSCIMVDMHDGQWHTWKAEVRGQHITWYIDGRELVNYEMLPTKTNRWHFSIFQQDEHKAHMDAYIDWVEYTPYFDDELKIIAPKERSEFAETKDIDFKAEVADDSIEKVDYYLNNVYVGSGYKKDNYVYTLKNAKVGQYKLKAKVENIETPELSFFVEKAFAAELTLDKTDVHYGDSVKATVTANSVSEGTQAEKVDFYLNGKLYSTDTTAPFEATYSGMQVGTGAVFARAYSKVGTVFETTPGYINVDYVSGKPLEIGREYTVDYKYTAGSGSFELKDGYFTLNLAHNGETVTYKTLEGDETYEGLGYGDYKVVVTAGYAELYYNNQFVTSYFMPYTPGAKSTSHSNVSDVSIKGSGVKAEVFHTDWEGKAEFVRDDIMDTTYYSVEFDKTDSSPEVVEFSDGVFENVLSFREDGIYAKRQLTKSFDATEVKLTDKVEPGYYRLTVGWGIAQLNLNNVPIGNYRCNKAASKRALKRTMTNPSASTFIAVKNTDDVYYHVDTFEEITELSSDDFWAVHPIRYSDGYKPALTATKKADANGNHYMTVKGKGVYLLNAIDQYPSFKWRGMVEKREGKVFTMFRRSFGDRHDKIGYDFDKNQWFYEMVQENGAVIEADVKTDLNAYKEGRWYDFELVCEGFNVKLLCDGVEVFSTEFDNNLQLIYYGRLGFGAIDGEYNFDDVDYSGKNRASAGLYYTSGSRYGAGINVGSFYKTEDGAVYATHETGSVKSTDGGQTWDSPMQATNSTENRVYSSALVKKPDGTMVRLASSSNDNGTVQSFISNNDGQTWDGPYTVSVGFGQASAVGRLTCTMDGRLFISTTQGGEYFGKMFVFYSDDGITWTKSETDFTTFNTGIIMNECIVVDTPRENEVWFWGRSDSGFLDYWVSYDNGKTFDLTPHHSGLMQSETCFRIERDWNNPNTYYAVFIYDTETSNDRYIQQPRNRATLGVSYDGMESWEFVCDIMEANDYPSLHTSDAMLNIIDDQVYWRTSNYAGYGGPNFGVQDMNKVKTLKRMPEFHKRVYLGVETMKHLAYEHCFLPKADGEAFVYGDFYKVKVADGRTDLDTVAKVFGVEVEKTTNGVVLKLGDGKVTFTEGSTSYDVNGEAKTAKRAVYQGGMLDIKTLSEVYGKVFRETEGSYGVMDGAELVDKFQLMLDELA